MKSERPFGARARSMADGSQGAMTGGAGSSPSLPVSPVTSSVSRYSPARQEWLRANEREWFSLAQLLVTTIDVTTKAPPRTIRGVKLNDKERRVIASFHAHMQRALKDDPLYVMPS